MLLYVQIYGIIFLATALNYLSIQHGHNLFEEYWNTLFRFDRFLRQHKRKIGYAAEVPFKRLLFKEILKTCKMDSSADIMGLLMVYLVVSFFIIAISAPPVAIALNYDPIGMIMEDFQILSNHFILKAFIRFVIILHCTLATVRSYATFYLPVVSTFTIFLTCLGRISKIRNVDNSIKHYTHLRIIQLTGMASVRILAGELMSVGFVLCVVGTWIVISGRKLFPVLVYWIMTLVTVVIYIVIAETLPQIVDCDELSRKLIGEIWPGGKPASILLASNFENKIRKRVLRSQKPLTFYYATASFDRETKHNFYYNIFTNTVNMVLLS